MHNTVIDTAPILAVLLAEPEKQAVVEATMRSVLRASVAAGGRSGTPPAGVKRLRLTSERVRQLAIYFEDP